MLRTSDEVPPESDNLLVEVLLARVGLHADVRISASARQAKVSHMPGGRIAVYCGDITLHFPNSLVGQLSSMGRNVGAPGTR